MNNSSRIAPRIIVAATLLSIATIPLFAQAKTAAAPAAAPAARSIADLRAIGISDFAFSLFRDPLLYPETALMFNPAAAAGFSNSSFFSAAVDLPYEKTESTEIRADDSIGQKGGSSRTSDESVSPDLSLLTFFPFPSKKPTRVYGIVADAGLDYQRKTTQNTNFDSISQSEVITDLTWPISASLGGLIAGGTRSAGWGVFMEYGFGMNLHAFRRTDAVVAGSAVTTWSSVLNPADVFAHSLDLRAGKRFPLSRSASIGVVLGLEGGLEGASTVYTTVDADGDGKGDSIMSFHDWYLSTGPGAPAVPATGYDRVDRTWSIRALLSPDLRIALADGFEIFLDGTWRGLDLDYRRCYEHISYSVSSTDASAASSFLNSSLTSGEVMSGVAIGSSMDSLWKIGAGYRRIDERYSQNGVDAAGNSTFSYVNPNHYPEAHLGATPANDAIAEAVAARGLPPWSDVTNAILLLAGWDYRAAPRVRLFASLGAAGSRRIQEYWVFNLDTRTSWTESITVDDFRWDLKAAAGMAIQLSGKTVLTLDCVGTGISGSTTQSSETLPFDADIGQDTTNGTRDKAAAAPFSLRVHAGLSFTY